MKYIANIISKSKTYKFVPWINVTTTTNNIDTTVPTLIVGTDMAKTYIGEELNYINRKVNDNLFWTYKVTEKRSTNESDINMFKDVVLSSLKKRIKFSNFNVIGCNIAKVKELLTLIKETEDICFIVGNKNLYISYNDNVIGVSFDELEYIGISKKKLLTKVSKFENKISLVNFEKDFNSDFFKKDEILLSAMFCYLKS